MKYVRLLTKSISKIVGKERNCNDAAAWGRQDTHLPQMSTSYSQNPGKILGYVEQLRLLPVDHNREIILDYLGDPM